MDQEFHKIKRLPPYVFAEVNDLKAKARAAGDDIVDFGMGNPDQPPPPHVIDKLVEVVRDPRIHRYSSSRGIPGLRKAIAETEGLLKATESKLSNANFVEKAPAEVVDKERAKAAEFTATLERLNSQLEQLGC